MGLGDVYKRQIIFKTNNTTALTLSGTQNATFSGSIGSGNIEVGASDSANGTITIHGGASGNAEGGEIRLQTSADHDGTYDFYRLDVINDDFRIGRQGQTDFYIFQDGLVKAENNFQAGGTGNFGNIVTALAYQISGQEVISNERKLTNIAGFSGTSSVTNGYDFNCTDNVANTSFTGMMIDHNVSGSDTLDADRTHRALYIDQDSSATGGDTNDEHRLYALHLTQDASGDSDLVYGANILSIAKQSSGQVSALRGINSTARANTSANVSTVIGVAGFGQVQGAGTVTGIYGGFFKGHVLSTNTANRSNAYGVYAEVENDSDTTLNNAYAIRSVIDRDNGAITNGYLLYGSYEGTRPTNAYGLYIASDVKNYFAGTVTIGNNTPDKNGLNVHMADAEIVINDTNNTPVLRLRESGTTKSVITTSSGALTLSSGGSAVALTLDTSQNAIFTADVTAFSDARLKDNIQTLDGKKALQMRGVSYMRDGKMGSGVIAQEIEKIAPELVKTANDEQDTKSVAYGNLVGYLIEAIKDQQKQIDELTEKLESVA